MRKKKRRQPWQQLYRRLLIEVTIILMARNATQQGDLHQILQSLLHLLSRLG